MLANTTKLIENSMNTTTHQTSPRRSCRSFVVLSPGVGETCAESSCYSSAHPDLCDRCCFISATTSVRNRCRMQESRRSRVFANGSVGVGASRTCRSWRRPGESMTDYARIRSRRPHMECVRGEEARWTSLAEAEAGNTALNATDC